MNNNFNGIFYFMEWIFDGIGTEIISLLIGLAGGGAIGYRIGIRNKNFPTSKKGETRQNKYKLETLSMMEIQKAGDNAQQFQIQNLTIGIDEKRAREIYDEKYSIAKKDFTEEALRIANERVRELENRLIPKMEAVNDGLKAFADPSFSYCW